MIRFLALVVTVLSLCAPVPAAAQSIVLLVSPKSGLKSVADFAAWAKRSKKPLAYSTASPASQRLGEALAQKLGIKAVHVPYRAASQGILDLIGGHIDYAVVDVGAAVGQIQGGLVTALAVAGKQRFPGLPDVPTFVEAGYPELAAVASGVRAASLNPASKTAAPVVSSDRPVHSSRLPLPHARY